MWELRVKRTCTGSGTGTRAHGTPDLSPIARPENVTDSRAKRSLAVPHPKKGEGGGEGTMYGVDGEERNYGRNAE